LSSEAAITNRTEPDKSIPFCNTSTHEAIKRNDSSIDNSKCPQRQSRRKCEAGTVFYDGFVAVATDKELETSQETCRVHHCHTPFSILLSGDTTSSSSIGDVVQSQSFEETVVVFVVVVVVVVVVYSTNAILRCIG
jgi:hypothetical protein